MSANNIGYEEAEELSYGLSQLKNTNSLNLNLSDNLIGFIGA